RVGGGTVPRCDERGGLRAGEGGGDRPSRPRSPGPADDRLLMIPGEILALTVEKPAAGGRMIARVDGRVALVSGTIPGEHVRGGRAGFFREGTHDLCDARQTRQLLPQACDTLERLAAAIKSLGTDAIREIELAENIDASERAAALETVAPIDPRMIDTLGA